MVHSYPYVFEPEESGGVLVQFVEVPEAHTFAPTEAEAGGDNALDCLIAALGSYIKLGRKIPRSSPAHGRPVATLPPLVAAKLARRLGLQENAVRRPLDVDRHSHIYQIDRASPPSANALKRGSLNLRNLSVSAGIAHIPVPKRLSRSETARHRE